MSTATAVPAEAALSEADAPAESAETVPGGAAATAAPAAESTTVYGVNGMSCGGCAGAVQRSLAALPGVREVEIDLDAKRAVVVSDGPLEVAAVRDAVERAGYQLA
jgi:copper chaperone CopZ